MKAAFGPVRAEPPHGEILDLWGRIRNNAFSYIILACVTLTFLILSTLYFVNMMRWTKEPNFGWTVSAQMGHLEIIHVGQLASTAGLKVGDRLLSVNGQSVNSLEMVRKYLDRKVPGKNVYEILRQGNRYSIIVQNKAKGFRYTFIQYGLTWFLGIASFILGAVVFFMKPGARPSWAYLSATFAAALYITFSSLSNLLPTWLGGALIFGATFSSAAIIHLANVFPVERKWVRGNKIPLFVPYGVSALLFLAITYKTSTYTDAPRPLVYVTEIFRGLAMLYFIVAVLWTYLRSKSENARVKAGVVLFGAVVALFLPVLDLFMALLFHVDLIPSPVYNLSLYIFFPLAIAYAIIKHNLFDVDLFVKRAVGYGLMSTLVGGIYVVLAMSIKPMTSAFPQLKQLSEIYPVLFALLVVFFFRPIHSKLQAGVDRLFYRGKYDYKDAVISLGDTLTTVYDLKEIIIRIIHAARDIMSIDSAGVILIQPEQQECPALFVYDAPEGSSIEKIEEDCLELDDPVVSLIRNEKKLITKYDIAEDPRYAAVREECSEQLKSLRATMALPLVFQGQTTGILMLGNKKSGHFFMGEDIDILTTLASQGAIAIENAKRAEILKDEEIVRSNLARYLSPQVVDNVMRQRMKVDLGGQRKLVTVLISDIRAFTDLVNTQHPDQLEKILNEYFTEMATIIFENKGSLDKYIGDAIVAVFGSLIPLQNPTVNAVDTSIRMVTRMADLNRKWAIVFNGFHMDIGVGIDTGEVFLGSVGSPDRMEFTVIGRAVNTAQLLSDIAQPDQILLTEDAVKAFGDVSRLRELDPLPVAGYDEQLKIFEIVMAKNNEGVITGTD